MAYKSDSSNPPEHTSNWIELQTQSSSEPVARFLNIPNSGKQFIHNSSS